jgi:hypothetical protein
MAIDKSYAARFTRWQVLVNNLPQSEAWAEDRRRLTELLETARALQNEKEEARSDLRKGSARLRQLAQQGDLAYRRLGSKLRGIFGFTSEELVRFGLKPRPIVRRRSKKVQPATEAPAQGESGAAPAIEPQPEPA